MPLCVQLWLLAKVAVQPCSPRFLRPTSHDPLFQHAVLPVALYQPLACIQHAPGQATPQNVTFSQSLCPDHLTPVGAPWYLCNQPRSPAASTQRRCTYCTSLTPHLHTLKQINWRLSDEPIREDTPAEQRDPEYRASVRTYIFLGYTSNLVSAGVREHIRWVSTWRGWVGGWQVTVGWEGRVWVSELVCVGSSSKVAE